MKDLADAQAVCDQTRYPPSHYQLCCKYWDNVFEYFLAEYKAGHCA
ncbi:hypothetical protein OK016_15770 [Vibrio chagasii]|nr:hypothetical protein [Vibrio chagasii]